MTNPTPPSASADNEQGDDELRKKIRGVLVNLVHDAFNASATEKAFTLGDDELNRIMEDIDRYTKEAERRAVEKYKAEQEVERWDDIQCPKGKCKTCDYHRPRLEAAKKHLAELAAPAVHKTDMEGVGSADGEQS